MNHEVVELEDAKGADVGQGLQLGIAESVGAVTIKIGMYRAPAVRGLENFAGSKFVSWRLIVRGSAASTLASGIRGCLSAIGSHGAAKAGIAVFVGVLVAIIARH
jgi:hypothetical protein